MSAAIIACKASADYTLWLRYSDGLQGSVDLGSLVEIGAFHAWRNVLVFLTARPDPELGGVKWPCAGIRLDPALLYHELQARGAVHSRPCRDSGFQRFMAHVLAPLPPRGES